MLEEASQVFGFSLGSGPTIAKATEVSPMATGMFMQAKFPP
jgi:hypothetical protein